MEKIFIRDGHKHDIDALFGLIKELAEFEKASQEVETTPEILMNDAFGDNPLFGFIIAEVDMQVVGASIYYFRYSTWKGKRLYIEDIIVTEKHRNKRIGTRLMNATLQKSLELNCSGVVWQVLDWNTSAIQFYKKFGAVFDNEWINVAISKNQITHYLHQKN